MNENTVRALTPLYICTVGGIIAIVALISKPTNELAFAALGLAGTAIGGAAGVAQQKGSQQIDIENSESTQIELPPVSDRPSDQRPVELPPIRPSGLGEK